MEKTMITRMFYFLFCLMHRNSHEHAEYLRKHDLFGSIGDNCRFQPYLVPSDAKHIFLHNNIGIGTGVQLICHDAVHKMLNNMTDENGNPYPPVPRIPKDIEIFDNVQIGANAIICPGVKIGPNAVVSAGAVVTKDVPFDSIVAGNPAQVVGSFSVLERMRRGLDPEPVQSEPETEKRDLHEIESAVAALLQENAGGVDVSKETEIVDKKLIDSLGLISVVTSLEEQFHCRIPFQLINAENFNSVERITRMIAGLSDISVSERKYTDEAEHSGKLITLNPQDTEKPVVQRIFEHALNQPEVTAIIANRKETSYRELADMIYSTAQWLKAQGVKEGDRVTVQAVHSDTCIACYYAIHLIGAVLVPVEKTAAEKRIREIAEETGSVMIIGLESHEGAVPWTDYSHISEIDHNCHFDKGTSITYPSLDLPCEMIFTTGTTGKSKGVLMAHRHMTWYANAVAKCVEMKEGNRFLLTTPLNHAGGLRRTHLLLGNGCCIVYLDGLSDLGRYFECIEQYHVTSLYLPPVAIRILLSRTGDQLSRYKNQIDFVYSSSSPLPAGDCEALRKLLPYTRLYNAYEASETPGVSAYDYNRDGFEAGCLGKANDGAEYAILTEDGTITKQADIEGQVCVKSRMNMLGYFNEPALTESVMKDGWFVSNDLGRLDEEGQLYLSGRKGDVINIGGYKIAPTDVEEAALRSSMIRECICIEDFDEYDVPYLKLLVVADDPESFDSKALGAFLLDRLETYKVPRRIELTESVNKTFNGKIDRKSYRKGTKA